jgi:cysteine desulfuration protein SufE
MELADIEADLELLEDWEERYSYLIDLGKKLAPMDPSLKTDAHKVHGCLSQVWYARRPDTADGRVGFVADSDSVIVRGLIAVLMSVVDGKRPEDIAAADPIAVFDRLGFGAHITANRRNGFVAMVERVRALARGR